MRTLIVGYGEIGKGLHKVIGDAFYLDIKERNWDDQPVDVLHICIPYSEHFEKIVNLHKQNSKLIIVHSTVPIGTCDNLQVVHSPIRGVHPHMAEGIKTFVKYFGGINSQAAAKIFEDLGIQTRNYESASVTEALKLFDTYQYGKLIMLEKEIHEWCEAHDLPFEVIYTQANKDYNKGYVELGRPEVVRPYLKHMEGPIGGHCVLPNAQLLGKEL